MIEDVAVIKVSFDEGDFDYVWCLVMMEDESLTFETFIGVGIDVGDWLYVSEECRSFDEKVLAYAQDWDEFESWVKNGAHDFTILDYEKKDIELSLG
jgi:hypothetical protein